MNGILVRLHTPSLNHFLRDQILNLIHGGKYSMKPYVEIAIRVKTSKKKQTKKVARFLTFKLLALVP